MSARGKFIVLEGIDGSGKRTQLDLLASAVSGLGRLAGRGGGNVIARHGRVVLKDGVPSLEYQVTEAESEPGASERGSAVMKISFPNYGGFFGKLVAKFLNGGFGALDAVDPHFSALLYAGDRLEAKPALEAALASGEMVFADRYIGSNLAHQGARVPREKRHEFLAWLVQLEYGIYELPVEDLVVYLQVPVAEAHRLIAEKGARDYTKMQRDIQESNLAHLQAASDVYEELAQRRHWARIECFDGVTKAMRPPEEIHRDVLAAVEASIFAGERPRSA